MKRLCEVNSRALKERVESQELCVTEGVSAAPSKNDSDVTAGDSAHPQVTRPFPEGHSFHHVRHVAKDSRTSGGVSYHT